MVSRKLGDPTVKTFRLIPWAVVDATIALTIFAGSVLANSPTQNLLPHKGVDIQAAKLTSGEIIQVKHDNAQLCHTLVKDALKIASDFSANPDNVVTDGEFCTASLYSDEIPNLTFPYRNAIAASPDISRTWSRGQHCCSANELLILWTSRPEGWHMVGTPPVADIRTARDLAIYLTGYDDSYCITTSKDELTHETVFAYGKQCQAISFVVPKTWNVNDAQTTELAPYRDAGSLVTSKNFKFIRSRTIMHRWLYSQLAELHANDAHINTKTLLRYMPTAN